MVDKLKTVSQRRRVAASTDGSSPTLVVNSHGGTIARDLTDTDLRIPSGIDGENACFLPLQSKPGW